MDVDEIIKSAAKGAKEDRRAGRSHPRVPQVSLLPVEIRSAASDRRVRRSLIALVAVSAAGVAAATALAAGAAGDAEQRQADASSRLAVTTAQLAKFKDVQQLQQRIALGTAARRVGSSPAIDWSRWRELVLADLPYGFTVTGFTADAATPYLDYAQGDSPLEKPRAATITVTATTASLAGMPDWLRELKSLPAYADLQVPDTTSDGSRYTVNVVVHLTTDAYETPLKGAAK